MQHQSIKPRRFNILTKVLMRLMQILQKLSCYVKNIKNHFFEISITQIFKKQMHQLNSTHVACRFLAGLAYFYYLIKSSSASQEVKPSFSRKNLYNRSNYFRLLGFSLELDPIAEVCLNLGSGLTFVNNAQILRQLSKYKTKKMSILLKIREIKTSKHKSVQFAKVFLFLPSTNVENKQIYHFF